MKTAYLSLGANLGDREASLGTALVRIGMTCGDLVRTSSIYETEPRDVPDQPSFLNVVTECRTELFPLQLLQRLQKIEMEMGRRRLMAKGPRSIDIDIVLYGDVVMRTAELEIPHPRFRERRFVLEPLHEIAPRLRDPVTKKTVAELLRGVAKQGVRLYEPGEGNV